MQTRMVAGKKVCRNCGSRKPVTEFRRDCRQKDGHQHRCRTCRARWDKQYRQKLADENMSERVESKSSRALRRLREMTRRIFGKPDRCAVPECRRKDLHWHHLNEDPRDVVPVCSKHHKLVHCP